MQTALARPGGDDAACCARIISVGEQEKTIRARESQRNCAEFAAILSTSFEPMLNGPYETKKGRYRKA